MAFINLMIFVACALMLVMIAYTHFNWGRILDGEEYITKDFIPNEKALLQAKANFAYLKNKAVRARAWADIAVKAIPAVSGTILAGLNIKKLRRELKEKEKEDNNKKSPIILP